MNRDPAMEELIKIIDEVENYSIEKYGYFGRVVWCFKCLAKLAAIKITFLMQGRG